MSVKLYEIQQKIAETLRDNIEFTTLCTDLAGSKLNFFINSNVERSTEEIPYFEVLNLPKTSSSSKNSEWGIQYYVGISGQKEPIEVNDISIFTPPKDVEDISDLALSIIKKELFDLGINGVELTIEEATTVITEVGETKDQHAIVTIVFESVKFINEEC